MSTNFFFSFPSISFRSIAYLLLLLVINLLNNPRSSFALSASNSNRDLRANFVSSEIMKAVIPEEYIKIDTYNGINIDMRNLPIGKEIVACASNSKREEIVSQFIDAFRIKLEEWKLERRKGIWVTISKEMSSVVPYLTSTEMGFDFQFAEKGNLVLTRWLPECESRLPLGPSHQVGVGCLLLHPKSKKMLCVQEKTGPAAKRRLWKMPTG